MNNAITDYSLMNASVFDSSIEAEDAFYTAFTAGDMEAMRQVWLDACYSSCIHPMGDRLAGTVAVLKSWETILKNTADVLIDISDRVIEEQQQIAIHTLIENIHLVDKPEQTFQFLATNIYQQTTEGWKLLLHHASPMPRDVSQEEKPPNVVH